MPLILLPKRWYHQKFAKKVVSPLDKKSAMVDMAATTKESQVKTDYQFGFENAKVGVYDKWYRYNRRDEGKEYDEGHAAGMKIYPSVAQTIIGAIEAVVTAVANPAPVLCSHHY